MVLEYIYIYNSHKTQFQSSVCSYTNEGGSTSKSFFSILRKTQYGFLDIRQQYAYLSNVFGYVNSTRMVMVV